MVKGKHSCESHDQSTDCRPEHSRSTIHDCFSNMSIERSNTFQDEVRSPLRNRIHCG
jgi:hypothetical protein